MLHPAYAWAVIECVLTLSGYLQSSGLRHNFAVVYVYIIWPIYLNYTVPKKTNNNATSIKLIATDTIIVINQMSNKFIILSCLLLLLLSVEQFIPIIYWGTLLVEPIKWYQSVSSISLGHITQVQRHLNLGWCKVKPPSFSQFILCGLSALSVLVIFIF